MSLPPVIFVHETCGCVHNGREVTEACEKHRSTFFPEHIPSKVVDQPPPKPGEGDIWQLVIDDMKERRQVGIDRYGTPLQPFNGRDALVDAYQESLDRIVYLRQKMLEDELTRSAVMDIETERDMATAYYKALEDHLRMEHGCQHDFAEVANGPSRPE